MSKLKSFSYQALSVLLCIYTLLCLFVSIEGTRDYFMPAEWMLVYGIATVILMTIFGIAGSCKSNRCRWILFGSGIFVLLSFSILEIFRELPPFVMWWKHLDYFKFSWWA